MTPCYLIDASIYIFRYYFSQQNSHLSKSGREVSCALAYFRWLLRFMSKETPNFAAACFDESLGTCFRNEIDANYKSNRTLPDDELAYQLLSCKRLTELVGLPCYASSRYEADDLLAALFEGAAAQGYEPIVLTRDKDLAQLLREDLGLFWDYGYDDPIAYDSFAREFGIAPARISEYLAIAGDTSDSIVGVKGVGKKTAATLFEAMGDWATIKNNLADIPNLNIRGAAGLAKKLETHVDLVDANLKLTELRSNCLKPEDTCIEASKPKFDELLSLLEDFRASPAMLKQAEALGS